MIVPNTIEKIKGWGRGSTGSRFLAIGAAVSYGCAMFLLGYAMKVAPVSQPTIQVTYDSALDSSLEYQPQGSQGTVAITSKSLPQAVPGDSQQEFSLDAQFVASTGGTKYYPIGCGSVSRIKEENRVYFVTEDEAKAAGYDRTTACK